MSKTPILHIKVQVSIPIDKYQYQVLLVNVSQHNTKGTLSGAESRLYQDISNDDL